MIDTVPVPDAGDQTGTLVLLMDAIDPHINSGDEYAVRMLSLTAAKLCRRWGLYEEERLLLRVSRGEGMDEGLEWEDVAGYVRRRALRRVVLADRQDIEEVDENRLRQTGPTSYSIPVRTRFTEADVMEGEPVGWYAGNMALTIRNGHVWDMVVGDWAPEAAEAAQEAGR